MTERRDTHLASGILAGIAGGLVASWVMNEFMENVGPSLQKAVQGEDAAEQQQPQDGEKPDDATMKTADAVVSTITGGRHLSHEGKEKGGPIVHYAFGAIMGAAYGAIAEGIPVTTFGFGTAFGAALFAGGPCGCACAASFRVSGRRARFFTGYAVCGAPGVWGGN